MSEFSAEDPFGHAVRAAKEVAGRCGLTIDNVEKISSGTNITLRLFPHDIVVRVSGSTALRKNREDAQHRELDVTRFLSDAGAPVVPPCRDADAGPHRAEGLVVTLWDYVEDEDRAGYEAAALAALRHCRSALEEYPGELPFLHGYEETRRLFLNLWREGLLENDIAGDIVHRLADLDAAIQQIRDTDASPSPLHGDAHLGNILRTDDAAEGAVWLDWEDVSIGPVEWDYACMIVDFRGNPDKPGRENWLLENIADEIDPDRLEIMIDARQLQIDMWDVALANR